MVGNTVPPFAPAAGHEQAVLGRRVEWLPDMDSNHDKEIQNLRCCHYTIGQEKVGKLRVKSSGSRLLVSRRTFLVSWLASLGTARRQKAMLVHTVLFWLNPDVSTDQRAAMLRGLESLRAIPSVESVHIGSPAAMPERPVRDSSYAYALTVIFKDIAAHDAYQVHPLHEAYSRDFRPLWSRVQVYDAM